MKSLLLALALLATIAAATAAIEWTRKGTPIIEYRNGATTIQLGLRSDGVVVWREITRGESVTNSPAEHPVGISDGIYFTNWIYHDPIVLTNFSRWSTNVYENAPNLR